MGLMGSQRVRHNWATKHSTAQHSHKPRNTWSHKEPGEAEKDSSLQLSKSMWFHQNLYFWLLASRTPENSLILSHQVCDRLLWQTGKQIPSDSTLSLLSTYGNIIKLVSIIWKRMKLAWGMTGFHAVVILPVKDTWQHLCSHHGGRGCYLLLVGGARDAAKHSAI